MNLQVWTKLKTKYAEHKLFVKVLAAALAVDLIFVGTFIFINFYVKDVTVILNGKSLTIRTTAKTVGTLLEGWDVKLEEGDVIEPGMDADIEDDMNIDIRLQEIKNEVVSVKTDFKTKKVYSSELLEGEEKVTTPGKQGEDKVTYQVTYLGGEEQSRKEIKRVTVSKPQTEVISMGTAFAVNGERYSRKLTVQATGYSGGGRTASGTRARVGEIAVDPRVIPLGSECYIEGFGTVYAEDTGGAVKGNIIDIYFASRGQAIQWGRRTVEIYIK